MAKPINGIVKIPRKNAPSVWENAVRIGMARVRFLKGIAPFPMRKNVSDQREELFFHSSYYLSNNGY
jgi:hypothetical protein